MTSPTDPTVARTERSTWWSTGFRPAAGLDEPRPEYLDQPWYVSVQPVRFYVRPFVWIVFPNVQ